MGAGKGREMMMLSSYDYLGLIGDPRVDGAQSRPSRKYGTDQRRSHAHRHHRSASSDGAGARRFQGDCRSHHVQLGYLANLAVVAACFDAADRVVMDSLSPRSLVDACRLAGVPLHVSSITTPAH